MHRRRVTRALGAAAGGLLGVAFLPAAVAFADSYEIIPDPSSTETLTGVYGLENTVPPAETGSIQGTQEFEVYDTTTRQVVGTFDADESNSIDISGDTNTELLVTHDLSGTVGTAAGDVPADNSIIDSYTYAGDQFGYVYSDLPSTTATETLTTAGYGDFPVSSSYDAIASESDTAVPPISLSGGDVIVPTGAETFKAVSGAAPYDTDIQGSQVFDVDNSAGTVIGTFTGDVTTTTDAAGTNTEAILVTGDGSSGTVGTAAGDIPAVGSVIDSIDYDGGPTPDIYSDLVSPTGGPNVISATDVTLFGDISVPASLDAVAAESDTATIPFDGGDITPTGAETFTGINGLPPADVAIQGTQEFDVNDSAGSGTFDADVTTTSTSVYDETTETLLVTSATGDAPAAGSMIDVANYGYGFETVYSDLVSPTGSSVITDTIVTPFGDFALPTTFDAASGLTADTIALF
ncbi:hypothetical protein [Mycobacterium sp.]|uniref:hypothetical protein n=1 Tax=Mycobacterium sp. TaxID=1785 RepID=UPI0031DE18DC